MPEALEKDWDAIVIGGGPAGSAVAIWLAREQKRVLLIEKEQAAHHKVCGEFISVEAAHYLETLGLNLMALGAERVDKICLVHGKHAVQTPLPFQAWSLSRFVLDESLLDLASAAGVHIKRGIAVNDLSYDNITWCVTDNKGGSATAATVFLATGKHNLKNWPRATNTQNDLIGFKMHFKLAPAKAAALSRQVQIVLFDGGYAGLEPIENGMANLCLVVKKTRYQACGKNWFQLLDYLCRSSPYLANQLAGAIACWDRPLAIFGIPYGYVYQQASNHENGLYRLGDQMAVIPSFSGDGMSIALHTARIATGVYNSGGSSSYHRQARQELLPLINRATILSKMASLSKIQFFLCWICILSPKLLVTIAEKTRVKYVA